MRQPVIRGWVISSFLMLAGAAAFGADARKLQLITIDPAHFHAALVQKEMYPQVERRAQVFAPLSMDLIEHLKRIVQFNTRAENPTAWELEIYTGADFEQRALKGARPGVVILSGRNSKKMERIAAAIGAGFHVLADKPWTLSSQDMTKLAATLDLAERKGLVAFDIMTERFDIVSQLARELVNDEGVFGRPAAGGPEQPGVFMESVHHILKQVAGVVSLRPLSFFDIEEQGEGLTDVGTHLVDLVQWTLFPNQALDWRRDIEILGARRWPTHLSLEEFRRVTGVTEPPASLRRWVTPQGFTYYCNNLVDYKLRGVHVRLNVLWNYEAPPGGGDTYEAVFRGTKSRVEIRQSKKGNQPPELYVAPGAEVGAEVEAALRRRMGLLVRQYPGVSLEKEADGALHVVIPPALRVGHEPHFAEVTRQFFGYVADPKTLPRWEKPNMLAKYWVTTRGVEMSRTGK